MTACLTENSAVLVYTWYRNAEQYAFGGALVNDSPLDTQEVADSSSVKPTTTKFSSERKRLSINALGCVPKACNKIRRFRPPQFDLLIHRKPVRNGRQVVGSARFRMTTPAPCYRKLFQQFRTVKYRLTVAFRMALTPQSVSRDCGRDPRRFVRP